MTSSSRAPASSKDQSVSVRYSSIFLARIVGKQQLHRVAEDVAEMDVDRTRGSVKVDVGIEIHAGIEEHLQGRKACLMNGKSLVRDDRVVNESGQIDRADRDAAHIGIAQDIVQVVGGIAAGDDRLEHVEPSRNAGVVFALFLEDHMRDLIGVELFTFGKGAGRTAADLADDRTEMVSDDDLAEFFVTGMKRVQVVVVEEMAKGAMADVVHERRDAEKFFDIVGRRHIRCRFLQKRIEVPCEAACHVHGAERVDEAGVFRGGIDPAGALELIDVPEALDPGRVDQVLFRPFVRVRVARRAR